jgi:hypothetical protein
MKKQQGLSFLGFIIIAVFVALAAITFFKVVPTYTEYFSIVKAVTACANEGGTPDKVREAFGKRKQIDYFEAVQPADLLISQVGEKTRVNVSYEKVVPLVANVSLLFEFEIDKTGGQ